MQEQKDTQIKSLEQESARKDTELEFMQKQMQAEQQHTSIKAQELSVAAAEVQRLQQEVLQRDERLRDWERQEQARLEAAAAAAERPPPPEPAEVKKELLSAFDGALQLVCNELAAKAGVAASHDSGASFCVGQEGFDSAAMVDAGLPADAMAEQYLRVAMDRAVAAVEPARVEAIEKWCNERAKRRQLQDQLQEIKGSIRVMCRVRPPAANEGDVVVHTSSDTALALAPPGKDERRTFAFDHVFGAKSAQASVFEEVEPVLDSVLNGFNVCIFAYGQTGSGKTFTMEGRRDVPEQAGINPRALSRLFEIIDERAQLSSMRDEDGWSFEVQVSYLEIYNEEVRDLLSAPSTEKKKLNICCVENQPVSVPDLTSVTVRSANEVDTALQRGLARRSVSATKMNATSSRSHSIVMVTVAGRQATTGESTHGKLHLVDLAGSERISRSGVVGEGLTEAKNINKSLSSLSRVMQSLQDKTKPPFRDSKLTQLLSDSLGGNSKTFMFVNISPASSSAGETTSSLEFAKGVRKVELGKASGKRVEGATLQAAPAARPMPCHCHCMAQYAPPRKAIEGRRAPHLDAKLGASFVTPRSLSPVRRSPRAVILSSTPPHCRHAIRLAPAAIGRHTLISLIASHYLSLPFRRRS